MGDNSEPHKWKLVFYLNVGKHVMSSNKNFLMCRVDCEENPNIAPQYIILFVSCLIYLESNILDKKISTKLNLEMISCLVKWKYWRL